MNWPPAPLTLVLTGLLAAHPGQAAAQNWFADISAGRVIYDRTSIDLGTNNATGTLRYDTLRGTWVYGSVAVPLKSGGPSWGAFGGATRALPAALGNARAAIGIDAAAHGFLFRDPAAGVTGSGGTIEAMPFVRLALGPLSVEPRGGWRGHVLSLPGSTLRRGVFEAGARAMHGDRLRLQADLTWVRAPEGTYPSAGGALAYNGRRFSWRIQAGRGLSDALDDVSWGAGASVAMGPRTTVWASARQDARDPLYWNATRRVWSVGITRQFGGPRPRALQPASRNATGEVLIRVPVAEVPGAAPSVAGDFNGWQPVPMQREGRDWVVSLPLGPGIYHYAFRLADGRWFVPPSVAGRRDDGMGGHVAVLVVG